MRTKAKPCKCDVTQDVLNKLFYVDAHGSLLRKIKAGNRLPNTIAGNFNGSALQVKIAGKCYLVHRVIWCMAHGAWPKKHIDHINGIATDNRIENLRECSHKENQQNRVKNKNNNCGFLGIYSIKSTGKFRASIMKNGENIHIGVYKTAKEASDAYLAAKEKLHIFNPKPRKEQITCRCSAYSYPHRIDGGKCHDFYNNDDISDDFKAGMLRDFERNEAQGYNNELSIFAVRF